MIYGNSILSPAIADWVITNGSITSEVIHLEANGTAKQIISLQTLQAMPSQMMLYIVATQYADAYADSILASLQAVMQDGTLYSYNVPVVNTGNGICVIEFPTIAVTHTSLTFVLRSTKDVTFSELSLYPPKQTDVDLTEVYDKLPRLLSDFNTTPLNVDYSEDVIAMIASYVTETTELTGHLSISYVATEQTELILRIKDNEITELYAPILFTLNAGRGTIGIPHAYLTKLKGYHNFTVTAQVLSGAVAIDTRKLFYVIDGGRIAYSVMDVGSVAYDITLRKTADEDDISYVYAICIDENVCVVKRCVYLEVPGSAWIAETTFNNVVDAAIEFNGSWNVSKVPYEFNTDEDPWYAWIDTSNNLYVKQLHSATAAYQLSADATKVAMIKGWDNGYTAGLDHGLLVLFVDSAGVVHYRGYCRQSDNTHTWEADRTITQFVGTAVEVNAFRTNDFRIGINILDDEGTTHTYITHRNWAGMSVPPENISSTLEVDIDVLEVNYINAYSDENISVNTELQIDILWASPDYTVLEAHNDGDMNIYFTLDHKLSNVNTVDFTIEDTLGTIVYTYSTVNVQDNLTFNITMVSSLAYTYPGDLTIKFSGTNGTLGEAGQTVNAFEFTFSPTGIEYIEPSPPAVEVIWNE